MLTRRIYRREWLGNRCSGVGREPPHEGVEAARPEAQAALRDRLLSSHRADKFDPQAPQSIDCRGRIGQREFVANGKKPSRSGDSEET